MLSSILARRLREEHSCAPLPHPDPRPSFKPTPILKPHLNLGVGVVPLEGVGREQLRGARRLPFVHLGRRQRGPEQPLGPQVDALLRAMSAYEVLQ